MQELKAAQRSVECSKQQLRRITHFMVEQVRNPYQRMKLEASVAAVHEERTEWVMKFPGITTTSATTAFTASRSQPVPYTHDTVGKNYSTVDVSAQQVAQSDQNALLDRSVVRAAVDLSTLCMHAFNTCQQTFQIIAAARVSVQQALARQLCIIASDSSMRAATAVRDCWEGALLSSGRMAAAHACILCRTYLANDTYPGHACSAIFSETVGQR
jgi:hypothetical protein